MRLKEILGHPCGFGNLFSRLEIQSSYARACLLECEMMTEEAPLRSCFGEISCCCELLRIADNRLAFDHLLLKLQTLKDIRNTIDRLGSGETLDDIELYELKFLGLLSIEVRNLVKQLKLSSVAEIPDLEKVVSVLDPDGLCVATFYVYDSYSEQLASYRAESRRSESFDEDLFLKINTLETEIRAKLSASLQGDAALLFETQKALAQLDILLAKSNMLLKENLVIPEIGCDGATSFQGLFHPEVKHALAEEGKAYQPVDISFGGLPVLIIGANMGGKTVVLKAVALSQFMCQFGFGVPAIQARIALKDEICFCIGDHQSITEGLSSFASEMRQIDALIRLSRKGCRVLALLDEPARTTNPTEGTALVRALLPILASSGVSAGDASAGVSAGATSAGVSADASAGVSADAFAGTSSGATTNTDVLLATHYVIPFDGKHRCLKVVGLEGDHMNYALTEVNAGEVPLEALNIASRLGVDAEWIKAAAKLL